VFFWQGNFSIQNHFYPKIDATVGARRERVGYLTKTQMSACHVGMVN
jgi:hypothetical protein